MPSRETNEHVVLLGDSIFDNAVYVPGGPAVIDQLREALPPGARATLLAVDGHVTSDVARQLQRLPPEATHTIVSIGGNDALGASGLLNARYDEPIDFLRELAQVQGEFATDYFHMLREVRAQGRPTAVCTI